MHEQMVKVWSLVVLCVALMCAGCATPEANVKSADLRSLSMQELDVGLTLDLYNPNEYSIPVEGIDWRLSLFDNPVANGRANPDARIPAGGRTDVDVPITLRLSDLADTAQQLIRASQIPYLLSGRVHFQVPTGTVSVDFRRDGQWRNPLR